MAPPSSSHVVIFPFMAYGHTNPALDLSIALSLRNLKVSIVTTPSNSKYIAHKTSRFHRISLIEIPFPSINGLPDGCENTAQLPSGNSNLVLFLMATKQLQVPFERLLQTMKDSGNLPLCVVSDFFLGWTLEVCRRFGVPRLVFHGMGVFSMALCKIISTHTPHLKTSTIYDPLDLPGIELPFTFTSADVPETLNLPNYDDPFSRFTMEAAEADVNSYGTIVNSFLEMEGDYVPSLQSFYKDESKIWCLGPLFLYDRSFEESNGSNSNSNRNHCSDHLGQWLDSRARDSPGSVIYASFGTQSDVSDAQLDEVALGLEDSGHPFLLVVKSATWSLPREIEERVIKSKGLVTKEFVDQRRILFHRATGGFLSHCGWNSVLESICAAVPILAWPMTAEQPLNAKLVVEGLKMGVRLKKTNDLRKEMISEGVREVMGGEGGRRARERARVLSRLGRRAVEEDGSSSTTLDRLIEQLRRA